MRVGVIEEMERGEEAGRGRKIDGWK